MHVPKPQNKLFTSRKTSKYSSLFCEVRFQAFQNSSETACNITISFFCKVILGRKGVPFSFVKANGEAFTLAVLTSAQRKHWANNEIMELPLIDSAFFLRPMT